MNAAVIGVGNMGQHHARNYSELKEVNLVAIADRNPEIGKPLAKRSGCNYYADYKEHQRPGISARPSPIDPETKGDTDESRNGYRPADNSEHA